jgi:hypothetical protein
VQGAHAAIVSSQVALITALNAQIAELGEVVATHFGHHLDTEIHASQPGFGVILSAPAGSCFAVLPEPSPVHYAWGSLERSASA